MAHMAPFAESDFDSIHSSQAFVGDHQVMYTPPLRAKRAPRFASTQSYILPEVPNTSQIIADAAGVLPDRRPPVKENQIVGALTRLQKQLDQAKSTIKDLIRERDEYRSESKALRKLLIHAQQSTPQKARSVKTVRQTDNELFDLDQYSEGDETGHLPMLTSFKPKPNLKATADQPQASQQKHVSRAAPHEVPPSRFLQKPASRAQQNQPQLSSRPPLRELSAEELQQKPHQNPQRSSKKVVIEADDAKALNDNTARTQAQTSTRNLTYLSDIPDNQPFMSLRTQLEAERIARQQSKAQVAENNSKEETRRSVRAATAPPLDQHTAPINDYPEDITAASNTSRRLRRRASDAADADENMTSAYILPDITVAKLQAAVKVKTTGDEMPMLLSEAAKELLHNVDPDHVVDCAHCRRLLRLPDKLKVRRRDNGSLKDWCLVLGEN